MTATSWVAVAVFVTAYLLIATERVHRVAAACGGAVVMLAVGATDAEHAFFSAESGIDWNVIFLLVGMMLIVSVLRRTGAFEYLAIWAVKRARGRPFPALAILVLVTGFVSAWLDNVTTVLLIAPVTFLVCERLAVPFVPFLIAEALASNIGGTATLIGDPPNIIIAGRSGLSFNDFLTNLAPLIAILLVVFVGICRVLFRSALRYDPRRADAVMSLRERDAIRNPRLLVIGGAVLAVVMAAFVLRFEPSVVAIVGGLVLLGLSGLDANEVARDVEWPSLVFFMGLFVMVGSLVKTGVIDTLGRAVSSAVGDRLGLAAMALLWGSAAISAIVDNIPYVATMSPVVAELARAQGPSRGQVLWWALALGADLGGNATAVGASANVVILGLAERAGRRISFWQFTKYGLVVTVVTVALCVPYLWLRYLV
jgi:Na+/H+ antiporter NhaD/arsenite permease-like protein